MEETSILIQKITGWWFQIVFMFTPIWGNDPIWLIFFKRVETTNQIRRFFSIQTIVSQALNHGCWKPAPARASSPPPRSRHVIRSERPKTVRFGRLTNPTHNKPKAGFKYVWCSSLCEQVCFNFLHVNLLRRDPPPAVRASCLGSHVCPRIVAHQNPGWLGYIGDYTTQLYRDYNDPV